MEHLRINTSIKINAAIVSWWINKEPSKDVDTYTFPEHRELRWYSLEIYTHTNSSHIPKIEKKNRTKNSWTHLYKIEEPFKAKIYFHEIKWQLLLVFKGTNVKHLQDLRADWNNILRNKLNNLTDSVFTLGEEVRKLRNKFKKRKPQLIITGHSLGGFLAQIAAYTIANFYVENGKVLKAERPHWGMHPHVVVFDSPSCFNMITRISGENPRTVASVWMDVTNFMIEQNWINNSTYQGVHIGTLIQVDPAEKLKKKRFWRTISYGHGIKYFSKIDLNTAQRVNDIHTMKIKPYDPKLVPCFAFSMEEWDLLKAAKCLLQKELAADLPSFTFDFDSIRLLEDNDKFVLNARRFVAKNEKKLNPLAIYMKHLREDLNTRIEASSPCKEEYKLDEQILEQVKEWDSGSCFSLPDNSLPEDRYLLAFLLCNSSSDFLCVKTSKWTQLEEKYKLLQLLDDDTTIILVDNENNAECNHKVTEDEIPTNGPKVLFFGGKPAATCKRVQLKVPGTEDPQKLTTTILDKSSRKELGDKMVNYLGNDVPASEVFSHGLLEDSRIAEIINFKVDIPCIQEHTHTSMLSISEKETFNVAKVAEEVKVSKGPNAIHSGPGTGKSWVLRQLRQELQKKMSGHWVVLVDITKILCSFEIQDEGFFEKALVPNNLDENTRNFFLKKLDKNQVVLLIDSAGPLNKNKDALTFIKRASDRHFKIIFTTEGEIKLDTHNPIIYPTKYYKLDALSKEQQVQFLSSLCNDQVKKATDFLEEVQKQCGENYQKTLRYLGVMALMCPNGEFKEAVPMFLKEFPLERVYKH